jgi:transcriptional regulator with XRE-family HTH domain
MRNATEISDIKSSPFNGVRCILQRMVERETLSDYVRRVMNEANLTYRQVEARAKGRITGGYVNDIVQRKTTNPSIEKLQALAKGLNRPEDEVISIAQKRVRPSDDKDFQQSLYYMLYEKSKNASPEKLSLVNGVLKMLTRELEDESSQNRLDTQHSVLNNKEKTKVTLPQIQDSNLIYKDTEIPKEQKR